MTEQIDVGDGQRIWGRVHVIGIGGAGMSGIARILIARGASVSGSDAKDSRRIAALRALGAQVFVGHDESNVAGAETVIASTAIKDSNIELRTARAQGIEVLTRADALREILRGSRAIAVSGTHGKTTTTSMLTVALQHCGADPSFAIGSELNDYGSNAHVGSGDLFVVEADESDGSFLKIGATYGIVTNIEPDHLDYWGDFDAIERAFLDFARGLHSNGGFVAVCIDDAGAARLADAAKDAGVDVRTYGLSADAHYRVEPITRAGQSWTFEIYAQGLKHGPVSLKVPGEHNVLNACAAYVIATGLGYDPDRVIEGLKGFSGTRRRFDFKGEAKGVRVYDDYAHHPTEIAATLRAARDVVGEGRLVVAFQAHHYYRTAMFVKEFGEALGLADEVVVLEVYAPGEEPIPGASGRSMADNVPLPQENVVFEPSWSKVPQHLAGRAGSGDIVMTLGAGDIVMLAAEVLELLREGEGDGL